MALTHQPPPQARPGPPCHAVTDAGQGQGVDSVEEAAKASAQPSRSPSLSAARSRKRRHASFCPPSFQPHIESQPLSALQAEAAAEASPLPSRRTNPFTPLSASLAKDAPAPSLLGSTRSQKRAAKAGPQSQQIVAKQADRAAAASCQLVPLLQDQAGQWRSGAAEGQLAASQAEPAPR